MEGNVAPPVGAEAPGGQQAAPGGFLLNHFVKTCLTTFNCLRLFIVLFKFIKFTFVLLANFVSIPVNLKIKQEQGAGNQTRAFYKIS